VPGFNKRLTAALENKAELGPEDAACLEARLKIGDEIEQRLGEHREEFHRYSESWSAFNPLRSHAEECLLDMATTTVQLLGKVTPDVHYDLTRLHCHLSRHPAGRRDIPMALAQSRVIFAADDKIRPLIDKLRVLLG
jgi:hypothetical protein